MDNHVVQNNYTLKMKKFPIIFSVIIGVISSVFLSIYVQKVNDVLMNCLDIDHGASRRKFGLLLQEPQMNAVVKTVPVIFIILAIVSVCFIALSAKKAKKISVVGVIICLLSIVLLFCWISEFSLLLSL